jgi:hypothetical protein
MTLLFALLLLCGLELALGLAFGFFLRRRGRKVGLPFTLSQPPDKPDKWSQFDNEQLAAIAGRYYAEVPKGRKAIIRMLDEAERVGREP